MTPRIRNWIRECRSDITAAEREAPTVTTVLKIIWQSVVGFWKERPGQVIGSAFVLLMIWGTHGKLEILGAIWSGWQGPGSPPDRRPTIIPGIPWDHELVSFLAGLFLLVLIPILIIKFGFKQSLRDYGLGLPSRRNWGLALTTLTTLTLLCIPAFWLGAQDPSMRSVYPFYKPIHGMSGFVLYQLSYLPFFIAIEFMFRGYLLFGLANIGQQNAIVGASKGPSREKFALFISMLSYTAWHLGKPLPELWGTLVWGFAAGATVYAVRSIWPVVISHWLLNVILDYLIARPF